MRTATLEELCQIVIGRTPARGEPSFWGPGHRWLSIADMNQGLAISETREQITDAGARTSEPVKPGTVLLSFKLSIGKVGIAETPLYTNEAIAALPIMDEQALDARYLMRSLQAMDLAGGSNRAAMGATLNKKSLAQIRIPLPGLLEQRRIAAILDHADALRVKRRQVLGHLNLLPQSIFQDRFGDPVENPRGFPTCELNDLIESGRPITYGILKPGPDVDGGVPYIRVADMKGGGIVRAGLRRTSHSISEQYKRSLLREGDLLMSIRGHVGRFAHIPSALEGANITQDSARLSISSAATSTYVRAAMSADGLQRWMARHTKGVAVRGLNIGDLRRVPIPLPPPDEQRAFAALIKKVDAQRAAVQRALAADDDLFESLQSRAFKGEL